MNELSPATLRNGRGWEAEQPRTGACSPHGAPGRPRFLWASSSEAGTGGGSPSLGPVRQDEQLGFDAVLGFACCSAAPRLPLCGSPPPTRSPQDVVQAGLIDPLPRTRRTRLPKAQGLFGGGRAGSVRSQGPVHTVPVVHTRRGRSFASGSLSKGRGHARCSTQKRVMFRRIVLLKR